MKKNAVSMIMEALIHLNRLMAVRKISREHTSSGQAHIRILMVISGAGLQMQIQHNKIRQMTGIQTMKVQLGIVNLKNRDIIIHAKPIKDITQKAVI